MINLLILSFKQYLLKLNYLFNFLKVLKIQEIYLVLLLKFSLANFVLPKVPINKKISPVKGREDKYGFQINYFFDLLIFFKM